MSSTKMHRSGEETRSSHNYTEVQLAIVFIDQRVNANPELCPVCGEEDCTCHGTEDGAVMA